MELNDDIKNSLSSMLVKYKDGYYFYPSHITKFKTANFRYTNFFDIELNTDMSSEECFDIAQKCIRKIDEEFRKVFNEKG